MTTQQTLLKLMCIPTSIYDGVCRTSDGCYLGRVKGGVGYDAFLGKPGPLHPGPGRNLMLRTWGELDEAQRKAVLALAAAPGDGCAIPLARDFGVPVS